MNLSEYIRIIKDHPEFGPAYTYHRHLPPVEAQYGPDPALPADLRGVLQRLGIKKFFRHQVDAMALQDGWTKLQREREQLDTFERDIITMALRRFRGVVAHAANELGTPRTSLLSRMKVLKIEKTGW